MIERHLPARQREPLYWPDSDFEGWDGASFLYGEVDGPPPPPPIKNVTPRWYDRIAIWFLARLARLVEKLP